MSQSQPQNHIDEQDAVLNELLVNDENQSSAAISKSSFGGFDFFQQLPVDITLEVASTTLPLSEVARLGKGDVVSLEKMVGEPIDVKVNGRKLGRGEVVDVNGRCGIRMLEIESDISAGGR